MPADDPAASAAPAAIGPVNYAVVVDESGSLKGDDMAREQEAALRIALGDVSPASTVTVLGFASANNRSQNAVDEVCPPTTLDAASRDRLGSCVGQLRSRKQEEGWDTDFPTAISQAVHLLGSGTDPNTPRVLFLLTDGKLDVGTSEDSPYGEPAHRTQAAQDALVRELAAAAAAKVQVWPMGFGTDIDKGELDLMAASGYQSGCVDLPDAKPRATAVPSSDAVGAALQTAFAAAHCLRATTGTSGHPPVDLQVRISPLATVGSIVVDKGDPQVTASYFDPNGRQVSGTGASNGSSFELAGRGQTVESLRITDPVPGLWRVHLDAPSDHRDKLATVSVLWHGELRSSITLEPPSPAPGQQMKVTLRLQTRQDFAITDLQDLQELGVSAQLTGDGFAPVPVVLADNGAAPDDRAKDGVFTGTVTVPTGATGRFQVAGTLTASGLTADNRGEGGLVAPPVVLVRAALAAPSGSVRTSDRLTGMLSLHNGDKVAHTLSVQVRDAADGLLTPSPAQLVLQPGDLPAVPVDFKVAGRAAFGRHLDHGQAELGGKVVIVDRTDGDRVLVDQPISLSVTPRPGWLAQYQWYLVVGGAVLVLLALLLVSMSRLGKFRRDAAGLPLRLLGEEGRELTRQTAKSGQHGWFEFDIVEPHSPHPRIVRRSHGSYRVRRHPDGGAVLEGRDQARSRLLHGSPVDLSNGLSLALGAEPVRPQPRLGPRTRPIVPPPHPAPDGGSTGDIDYV
ncbi:vWA domain-containing protein [Kitasatospora azatica]|uniref:vWA domain-containing protein n=1 Tax=Kitasatospora azatica TaxID=58347 RepID=UPI0012FAACA7|nr:vWA domain-containing protein [Kitasatospora azatica]